MSVQNNAEATKMLGGVTGKGWMPGQSGNPGGRPKSKFISEALRIALESGDADEIAKVLLALAKKNKSVAAISLIADRTEGRAPETLKISGSITHEYIDPDRLTDAQLAEAERLVESASAGSDSR